MATNGSGLPIIPAWVYPLLVVVLGILIGVGSCYASFNAPCSWFEGSPVTAVPVRCLKP